MWRNNYTFSVVSLGHQWNILYPPAYTKKNHYNFASLTCEKRQSYFYAKTWSWDVSWLFRRKFMAIRFFSDPVRVLSIGRNPIQVLLIRSDPLRVLSIRSDPIRSRFCKRPASYVGRKSEVKKCWQKGLKMLRAWKSSLLSICWIIKQLSCSILRNIVWF